MDARNHKVMRRQLAGRRTAAALEWLLKRHQERQQTEQAAYRVSRDSALGLVLVLATVMVKCTVVTAVQCSAGLCRWCVDWQSSREGVSV
jgi:hypothetical protein